MEGAGTARGALEDVRIDVKLKLAALWTSVMFCYIYADYFGLYIPGRLQRMLDGKMGPLGPTTQGVLLGTSIVMAIPSVMIFLSLALRPGPNRVLNIIVGALFTAIIMVTMWDWAFYIFFGVVEILLTGSVVWHAWTWPRREATS